MSQIKYRSDIDGLRAIAVLAVVVFHAFPRALTGGFAGVDVFFVISGYLITGSILDGLRDGTFTIKGFYARRVRRIFPALAVVLFATLVAGSQILFVDEYKRLISQIINGAAFVANVKYWLDTGYFDQAAVQKPLLHLWSLGIEEQFYFAWPLLLAFGMRTTLGRRLTFVVLPVTSLIACAWLTTTHQSFAFYMLPTRFWELAAGGMLARYGLPRRSPAADDWASAVGLGLLGLSYVGLARTMSFPGVLALVPVVGAALILGAERSWINRRALTWAPLAYVGRISYPLYLWHWPPLAFAYAVNGGELHAGLVVTLVGISFALAAATYHLIEKPYRFGRFRKVSSWAPLYAVGAVAILASIAKGSLLFVPAATKALAAELRYEQADHVRGDGRCPADLDGGEYISYCRRSVDHPRTGLIGDSHAEALYTGLASDAKYGGVLMVGHQSCPPLLGTTTIPDCAGKMERIVESFAANAELDTVVISSASWYVQSTSFAADHRDGNQLPTTYPVDGSVTEEDKLRGFEAGLERTLARFGKTCKRVVFVRDVPELPFFARACAILDLPLRRSLKTMAGAACVVPRAAVDERQRNYDAVIDRVGKRHPGVRVLDPKDYLCTATECAARADGALAYRDSHHLSAAGSRWLIKRLFGGLSKD